jgi:hypothetical protein
MRAGGNKVVSNTGSKYGGWPWFGTPKMPLPKVFIYRHLPPSVPTQKGRRLNQGGILTQEPGSAAIVALRHQKL